MQITPWQFSAFHTSHSAKYPCPKNYDWWLCYVFACDELTVWRDAFVTSWPVTSWPCDELTGSLTCAVLAPSIDTSYCVLYTVYSTRTSCNAVGLKSDGTTGQTTGHLEVNTPRATVPSLSTCDGRTTGHWPVALFKRRDRRWDTFNCPSLYGSSSRF